MVKLPFEAVRWLARRPGQYAFFTSAPGRLALLVPVVCLMGLGVFLLARAYWGTVRSHLSPNAELLGATTEWRYLTGPSEPGRGDREERTRAGAPMFRKAPVFLNRPDEARTLLPRQGSELWLASTWAPAVLAEAARAGRSHLILGEYRHLHVSVYLDGDRLMDLKPHHAELVALPVGIERLRSGAALSVVLRLRRETAAGIVRIFAPQGLGRAGFGGAEEVFKRSSDQLIAVHAKTWVLAAISGIAVLWLIGLWLTSRQPEFFFLAWFNVLVTMAAVRNVPFYYLNADGLENMQFYVFSVLLHACGGLLVAMAYARIRAEMIWAVVALSVLSSGVFLVESVSALGTAIEILRKQVLPAFYLGGAALCASQAYLVSGRRHSVVSHPERVRSLLVVSGAFALMALLEHVGYVRGFATSDSPWRKIFDLRFVNLAITIAMVALFHREYRRTQQLVQNVPVSRFHRLPVPPESLHGMLVAIDLKGSEALFRDSSLAGAAQNLIARWRSEIYLMTGNREGVVLSQAGDQVSVFFPSDPEDGDASLKPLAGFLDEHERRVRALAASFRRLNPDSALSSYPFLYRVAACFGDLRPHWEDGGETRIPAWSEAGTGHVFVDAARLLELEKKIPGAEGHSLLLFSAGHAALRKAFGERVRSDRTVLKGKHSVYYIVSVVDLGEPPISDDGQSEPERITA